MCIDATPSSCKITINVDSENIRNYARRKSYIMVQISKYFTPVISMYNDFGSIMVDITCGKAFFGKIFQPE